MQRMLDSCLPSLLLVTLSSSSSSQDVRTDGGKVEMMLTQSEAVKAAAATAEESMGNLFVVFHDQAN